MKSFIRYGLLFFFVALRCHISLSAQTYDALDAKLDEYVSSMRGITVEEKFTECDFVISSVADSAMRNHVAVYIYSKFISSPLMGDDAVAIYLTDNWFVPGRVSFGSYEDLATARIFADFNRQSLIGEKAPSLVAQSSSGLVTDALQGDGDRLKVLFIYDTSCATCKFESLLLTEYLASYDGPALDFIAFYAGTDAESWRQWQADRFTDAAPQVNVRHFWDPDSESDVYRKYGVLSTPRMFLIDKDGTIVGRSLDTNALKQLISSLSYDYEYGREEMMNMFDNLFDNLPVEYKNGEDIAGVARILGDICLEKKDTLGYKQYVGDMLYYLSGKRTWTFQEAIPFVADSLIIGRPDIWTTEDDYIKVVSMAEVLKGISALAPIGEKIPAIRLPGVMCCADKQKKGEWRLDKIGGNPSVVIFHVNGCQRCENQLEAMHKLLARREFKKYKFFLVDMDELFSARPAVAQTVLEKFDLSVLPFILTTDRKGRITGKYISLEEWLEKE